MAESVAKRSAVVYQNQNACKGQSLLPPSSATEDSSIANNWLQRRKQACALQRTPRNNLAEKARAGVFVSK
jgi:hypothetical protein